MNILDAHVKRVLSEPVYNDKYAPVTWWEVEVEYTCWSPTVETRKLSFKTKEEADAVTEGYVFYT